MSKVLLSFCIPTYNRPERISNLIEQIISFESKEIEIVIGDDNPLSNRTQDVLKKFTDSRIKYFRNKTNLGMDGNLIKIIYKASGEFIFIVMDDDDIEMKTIPWILKMIKKNKNITQFCGALGDLRAGKNRCYYIYEDKFLSRGFESLNELLFYNHHGSGVVLRKNALDLKKAIKNMKNLYIYQNFIAQAMIAGDTLCTSKIFAYIGKEKFWSQQTPLFKGKGYGDPLSLLLIIKFRIQTILDISDGKIRDFFLNKQKRRVCLNLYRLYYLYRKNTSIFKTIQAFLTGIVIIISMKEISRSFKFWLNLFYGLFLKYLENSRFKDQYYNLINFFNRSKKTNINLINKY